MTATRRKLLENFDDEVRDKLKVRDDASRSFLNRFERQLIDLTRHELNGHARFHGDSSFDLLSQPFADSHGIALGRYELPRRSGESHLYRLGHPLAEKVVDQAKARDLPIVEVEFCYADHDGKISILEPLRGKSGMLAVSLFTVESMAQAEDHLVFVGTTDDEMTLEEEQVRRMLTLPARTTDALLDLSITGELKDLAAARQEQIQREVSHRNARFFEEEAAKLDGWADDLKAGLEREIKEFDRMIKEARRTSATALTLEEKLASQKQIKAIEAQRNDKRRSLFEAQDEIDKNREQLISQIEGKLSSHTTTEDLFLIRWKITH
jgi:adenine-specific DNA-methyltransferase